MIDLALSKGKIELSQYPDDTTLAELADALEAFLADKRRKNAVCHRCGDCCNRPPVLGLDLIALAGLAGVSLPEAAAAHLMLPDMSNLTSRQKGIKELRKHAGLTDIQAAILYEYNQSEPLTFPQNEDESCIHLQEGLCDSYSLRPYICRLYQCSMGDRLQSLREMIACQGTWHAYALLGFVPMEEIAHNPFVTAGSYSDVKLKDFEFDLTDSMGELFSYF